MVGQKKNRKNLVRAKRDKELLRISLLHGKDQGRRIPTRQWGEGTLKRCKKIRPWDRETNP